MRHELFPSVAEMISPPVLTTLLGQPIDQVERIALTADYAHSGSGLEFLDTTGNRQPGPRLVLKRIAAEWDWLMRATADDRCRSTTVWSSGLLDRLPERCALPVIACSYDALGWAILMPDYSATLMSNTRFTGDVNDLFLDTMAAMHAAFLDDPVAGDPETGLCIPRQVYRLFAPVTAEEELRHGRCGEIPGRILEGWALAHEIMPADVMEVVEALLVDPAPLCTALDRSPGTLVHGDFRHSNLGVLPGRTPRAILLDWQLAAFAPPSVELGRYLGANSPLLPVTKDACLELYEERLAYHLGATPLWWQPQLDLGMLGGFVQDGWAIVLKATHWRVGADAREHWKADLDWWAERVRRGAKRLG